jgi:hypothetical protein
VEDSRDNVPVPPRVVLRVDRTVAARPVAVRVDLEDPNARPHDVAAATSKSSSRPR